MRAFQVTGICEANVTEVFVPSPASDEVLLQVLACGICKTDAKIFMVGHRDLFLPRIPGHELVGMDLESKQRYIVFPGKTCGTCSYCKNGSQNLCPSIDIFGFSRDGGFAERIVLPKNSLIPISPDISSSIATLAEPLGCSVNALSQMDLPEKTDFLIFGAGVMGLLIAFAAYKMNLNPILCDVHSERIEEAKPFLQAFSISVVAPENISFPVSAAIAATSAPNAAIAALSFLRPGGTFCHFSGMGHLGDIPGQVFDQIHYKQLKVCGAYGCSRSHMETALAWIFASPKELSFLIRSEISLEKVSEVLPIIWQGSSSRYVVCP